ncbi:MAG: hypothetical protein ABIP94_05760 [Planctomycetota bacterium]
MRCLVPNPGFARNQRLIIVALACASSLASQAGSAAEFTFGSATVDGHRYPYRLLEPMPHQRAVPRPLVVFLHGAGERGEDNQAQLTWLPRRMAEASHRERFPCYVLAVQCPAGEKWVDVTWGEVEPAPMATKPTPSLAAVMQVIAELVQLPGVDPARVYLTGLSMGGYGTWDLAMRRPHWFAAAVPICGGGDPRSASALLGLPIQIWHGADDRTVPVIRSQQMAAALGKLGAVFDYREVRGVGHDVWRQAFDEGGALPWLFAQDQRQQQRGRFAMPALVPAPDTFVSKTGQFVLLASSGCMASERARASALLLLDALELPAALRPGLLGLATPRRGDLVVTIDGQLRSDFVIDVGESLQVTGRDEAALRRGVAAAVQALRTLPDHTCPAGRIVRARAGHGGRVVLGPSPAPWHLDSLLRAIRLCWLHGATELEPGPAGLALQARESELLRQEALRCGVLLVPGNHESGTEDWPGKASVVFDSLPDLQTLLTQPLPADANGGPFLLRLPPGPPDTSLDLLALQLPTAAERVQKAGRTFHVGGFLSRLACQLRP